MAELTKALCKVFLSTPSARRATQVATITITIKPFLSTPSARRATQRHRPQDQGRQISIHALREEGDARRRESLFPVSLFLSTPSARRATHYFSAIMMRPNISIHALREEGDLADKDHRGGVFLISIHALREEGDATAARWKT